MDPFHLKFMISLMTLFVLNFLYLDGDVPHHASYGVYISQLIRFASVCNHVTDFNVRNKCSTAKFLNFITDTMVLTYLSLVSLLWDIGKQNNPRCDAAELGIPFRAILFA